MLSRVQFPLEVRGLDDHDQWLQRVRQIPCSNIPTLTEVGKVHPHIGVLIHEAILSASDSLSLPMIHESSMGHLLSAEKSCEHSSINEAR